MYKLLFLLLIQSLCNAQTFQIGTLNVDFIDTSRNNRVVNTRIYYPANTAGNNVPITNLTTDQFPVLTFGHGFLTTFSAYQNIWEALVPNGYIVAFPNTEMSILPSHLEFARDIVFVNNTIKNLGNNATSIFYNRVHPRSGVMGHSMGGGAAHVAATLSSNIQVILTLSAAETTPSAITASASINIPTLVIAGGNDCVTVPLNTQIPIYNAIVNAPCKSFISINGASHCQMAIFNFNCNLGDSSCQPQPTITRDFQHQILNQFMNLWLDGFLKQNCQRHLDFLANMSQSTAITFQNSCSPCVLSLEENSKEENLFYPNPVEDVICFKEEINFQTCMIYNSIGKQFSFEIIDNHKINTQKLPKGIYFLKIITESDKVIVEKFLKN